MDSSKISELEPDDLKKLIAEKKEKDFILVDVREEFEYNQSHIPGAVWIKLSEIEKKPDLVPDSEETIFYCHSGSRSMAAAKLFSESEKSRNTKKIANLKSGILGWNGAELQDIPKIDVFKNAKGLEALITRAMELEKGAYNLYSKIYDNYKNLPYIDSVNMLKKAETAHARTLFKRLGKPVEEFEEYFDSLSGDILESGISTDEALKEIENIDQENLCINLLEFLLLMEVSAYDLYKVMAEKEKDAQKTFLTIAQEEKNHMRTIASSFLLCG